MNVRKHVLAEERDLVSFSKYNSHHWESWENVNDGKCSVPYSSCSEPSDCLWSKPLLHKRASHRGNKSKQVEIFNTGLQGQHDLSRVCKLKDGRKKKHFTLLNFFFKKKHTFNTKLQGTVQYIIQQNHPTLGLYLYVSRVNPLWVFPPTAHIVSHGK